MSDKTHLKYGEPFNPYGIDIYAPAYNCILQSSLKDPEKLLLIKLCQYAGKKGEVFPKRKTLAADLGCSLSKLDKNIASLKKIGLIRTEKTGCHSSSKFTFLYHEIYDSSITDREPAAKDKQKEITLRPETIELIEYWNLKENLTTHKLEGKQTNTVRELDSVISGLVSGAYYKDHDDVPAGAIKPLTLEKIKMAIDRMAIASGPDYYEGDRRMTFLKFIYNPRMTIGTGRDRHRYKYPLLHYINNTPKPLSKKHTRKKTKYEGLVNRVIEKITKSKPETIDGPDYNKVVKHVEKAVSMMDSFRPTGHGETSITMRMRLPDLLYDSMEECGKGIGIKQLGLAVSHLEEMMRRRLIIK